MTTAVVGCLALVAIVVVGPWLGCAACMTCASCQSKIDRIVGPSHPAPATPQRRR